MWFKRGRWVLSGQQRQKAASNCYLNAKANIKVCFVSILSIRWDFHCIELRNGTRHLILVAICSFAHVKQLPVSLWYKIYFMLLSFKTLTLKFYLLTKVSHKTWMKVETWDCLEFCIIYVIVHVFNLGYWDEDALQYFMHHSGIFYCEKYSSSSLMSDVICIAGGQTMNKKLYLLHYANLWR